MRAAPLLCCFIPPLLPLHLCLQGVLRRYGTDESDYSTGTQPGVREGASADLSDPADPQLATSHFKLWRLLTQRAIHEASFLLLFVAQMC